MLTPDRLQEIKARCERATPGPWKAEPEVDKYGCETGSYWLCMGKPGQPMAYEFDRAEDAEFCAHARDDVPALVAEVERLHALLSDLRNLMGSWRREAARCRRKADDAIDSTTFACFDSKAVALSEAASDLEDVLNRLEAKQHA